MQVYEIQLALNLPPPPVTTRPSPESFCENFNLCFPPGETSCPDQKRRNRRQGKSQTLRAAAAQAPATTEEGNEGLDEDAIQDEQKTKATGVRQQKRKKTTGWLDVQDTETKKRTESRKNRAKRDLEGALKVVQLTDVHLDPEYAEVQAT